MAPVYDAAKADADYGEGPFTVVRPDPAGFFVIRDTRNGSDGRSYPLHKTAAKACRLANAALGSIAEAPAQPKTPPVAKSDKRVKRAVAKEKARTAPERKAKPAKSHKATHSTVIYAGTREEWLNAFVAAARPVFVEKGFPLPDKIRVSVGFTGARGGKKVLGACWHEEASTDRTREIFVVPTLDDSHRIASVLTHELAHTRFGPDEKHGRNFAATVHGMGLEGKATSAGAGHLPDTEWHVWADPIIDALGTIPHAALDPSKSGVKKQKTRLLKGVCEDCGFTARLTAKWVNKAEDGLQCPDRTCGGTFNVVIEGEEEGEEG